MSTDSTPESVRKTLLGPARTSPGFLAGLLALVALHTKQPHALRFAAQSSSAGRRARGKNKRGHGAACFSRGPSLTRLGGYRFPATYGWARRRA